MRPSPFSPRRLFLPPASSLCCPLPPGAPNPAKRPRRRTLSYEIEPGRRRLRLHRTIWATQALVMRKCFRFPPHLYCLPTYLPLRPPRLCCFLWYCCVPRGVGPFLSERSDYGRGAPALSANFATHVAHLGNFACWARENKKTFSITGISPLFSRRIFCFPKMEGRPPDTVFRASPPPPPPPPPRSVSCFFCRFP